MADENDFEEDEASSLSVDEVRQALEEMTVTQLGKLRLTARWLTAGTTLEPDDLLSRAVLSCLSTRSCPRDVPVLTFVAGAMKSLASAEYKAIERAPVVPFARRRGDSAEQAAELADKDALDPEQICLLNEKLEAQAVMVRKVSDALAGDYDAQLLLEGWAEGLRGEELREFVGKDQAGLDYLAKRVRRTIRAMFPKGWPQ